MLRWPEIAIILVVLLFLFGASRLPQLGSSLGSALRNFKKGFSGDAEKDEPSHAEKNLSPGSAEQAEKTEKEKSRHS